MLLYNQSLLHCSLGFSKATFPGTALVHMLKLKLTFICTVERQKAMCWTEKQKESICRSDKHMSCMCRAHIQKTFNSTDKQRSFMCREGLQMGIFGRVDKQVGQISRGHFRIGEK